MVKIMWSGHSEGVREIVARRLLSRYFNNLKNYEETRRQLYRSIEERKEFVKENKATWFRQEGATATLMVPWTPDSSLAKGLRKVLESVEGPKGTKVKIVEKPGVKITAMVQNMRNFRRLSCGRLKCPLKNS